MMPVIFYFKKIQDGRLVPLFLAFPSRSKDQAMTEVELVPSRCLFAFVILFLCNQWIFAFNLDMHCIDGNLIYLDLDRFRGYSYMYFPVQNCSQTGTLKLHIIKFLFTKWNLSLLSYLFTSIHNPSLLLLLLHFNFFTLLLLYTFTFFTYFFTLTFLHLLFLHSHFYTFTF